MTYRVIRPYADPHMQKLAEWTASMLDASYNTARLIGCTPAAIVAQAALESGWGAAAIGNNLFGIKADKAWHGARQLRRTWEHLNGADVPMDDWFRDYPSLAEGIEDHFEFLKKNTRYADVFDPNNQFSDSEYFRRLQVDGYATAPNYADQLDAMLSTVQSIMKNLGDDNDPNVGPLLVPRPLLVGTRGGDVASLQGNLQQRGFYKGAVDGDFGPLTRDAVVAYQTKRGLTADGIVGPETAASLRLY